jgi:hypothetical protein
MKGLLLTRTKSAFKKINKRKSDKIVLSLGTRLEVLCRKDSIY